MARRNPNPVNHDLVVSREIRAPRSIVFEAWTSPQQVAKWWGPEGFSNPRCELDVRPGGAIRIDMLAPDGTVYPMGGFYQEIIEPEKLIFSSSPLDGLGHSLLDLLNTVTFAEKNGKTKVTNQIQVLRSIEESVPYLEGMETGWNQTLARLDQYLAVRHTH